MFLRLGKDLDGSSRLADNEIAVVAHLRPAREAQNEGYRICKGRATVLGGLALENGTGIGDTKEWHGNKVKAPVRLTDSKHNIHPQTSFQRTLEPRGRFSGGTGTN